MFIAALLIIAKMRKKSNVHQFMSRQKTYYMIQFVFIRNDQNKQICRDRKQIRVYQGLEWEWGNEE
jgi:hypothetical protein